MAFGKPVVWAQAAGPGSGWIWGRNVDLFWIAGGGFFLFAAVALPMSLWAGAGAALTWVFLKLAILCNYPHYAATYQVIVRERVTRRRNYYWLLASTPVMVGLLAVSAMQPDLLWGPVVRLYLTWSAHHYAAQHFGLAAMYSARFGRPMEASEKTWMQAGFLGIGAFMMLMANTVGGDASAAARVVGLAEGGGYIPTAGFPPWLYPIGLVLVAASTGAFLFSERRLKRRTGRGFEWPVWMLFATNFAWFVLPNVRLPGGTSWMSDNLALVLLGAPPFFHCAQYLAVTGHRSLQTGPVRPIWLVAILVWVGFLLFNGPVKDLVPVLFPIDFLRGLILIAAIVNLHHFWMDGLMWRRPRKAPKPASAPISPA